MIQDINDLIDLSLSQKDYEWTTKLNDMKMDNTILEQIDNKYKKFYAEYKKPETQTLEDALKIAKGVYYLNNLTRDNLVAQIQDKNPRQTFLEGDNIVLLACYDEKYVNPILELFKLYFNRDTARYDTDRFEIVVGNDIIVNKNTYDYVRAEILALYNKI